MAPVIDRCIIIVKPTQEYLKWTESLDGESATSIVDDGKYCNSYLIRPLAYGTQDEARKKLRDYWKSIAEEEFNAWWTDENDWPDLKNLKDFERYFEWSFHEVVFDLVDAPISKES